MKKILALTLAAVMAAGMTTVAFAVDKDVKFEYSNNNNYIVVDRNDSGKFGDGKAGDADIDVTYNVSGGEFTGFKREDGGKKIAIPVYDKKGNPLTDEDELRGWKVKADWAVGDGFYFGCGSVFGQTRKGAGKYGFRGSHAADGVHCQRQSKRRQRVKSN